MHVQYVRELLDNKILQAIIWVDTRDMASDGLTKGTVPRDLLHQHMLGNVHLTHTPEMWITKKVDQIFDAATLTDDSDVAAYVKSHAPGCLPSFLCMLIDSAVRPGDPGAQPSSPHRN